MTHPWNNQSGTTALIVLLIVELIGISIYTYIDIRHETSPEVVVDRAEAALRENFPRIRQEIQQDIEENAPEIAEALGDELLMSMPQLRSWIEETTATQLEYGLEEATELSAEQFRLFLRDNRPQIIRAFEELEDAPEESHRLLLELETEMDRRWGVDLKNRAYEGLKLHRALNDKLQTLSSDRLLEPKELLEQRIIRIVRALEQEHLPVLAE